MEYKLSNEKYSNNKQMTSLTYLLTYLIINTYMYDFRVIPSLINFIHPEGRVNKQKHCSPSCRRRTAAN